MNIFDRIQTTKANGSQKHGSENEGKLKVGNNIDIKGMRAHFNIKHYGVHSKYEENKYHSNGKNDYGAISVFVSDSLKPRMWESHGFIVDKTLTKLALVL